MYNTDNIFAKIIRGESPASKVYEDEHILAIEDINPVAPVHILVMPKGHYKDFSDFGLKAPLTEIANFFKKVTSIANDLKLEEYRIISNNGKSSGQTIFHFHVHIIAGSSFSKLV